MKFFENVYGFIAKKWDKIFVLVGLGCYALGLIFTFIGQLTDTNGKAIFLSLVSLVLNGAILAGLVFGYFFKKKNILLVSLIVFLAFTLQNGLISQAQLVIAVDPNNGAQVASWIFGLFFDLALTAYIVLLVLIYIFNFKKLDKVSHIVYLAVFPLGLLAWIMGIVYTANQGSWYNAILPLIEAASFLFIPAFLATNVFGELEEEKAEEVAAEAKSEEEAPEEKVEEEVPEEKVEESPQEAVEAEVEEEAKE